MRRQPASALDLFTDSVRLLGDATLVSVLEFDRHLDHERLHEAVRRCFEAHPILSSKLVRDRGPAFWEMQDWNDAFSEVPIIEVGDDYRPYVIKGVDPYTVPQVRFRILRSSDRDVIVINLAHAASDGRGMKELTRALLEAYNDPSSVPKEEDGLPPRDTLWTRALLEEDEGGERESVPLINPMWPSPFPSSEAPPMYHRAVISAEGVGAIKRMVKSRGGTINDAFMAAYFLALSDLTGHNGPQRLFFPVDLRKYLTDGSRIISNQSANVSFPMKREEGEGMHEVLDKVIAETSRMKKGKIGIREQVEFDRGSDPEGRAVHEMVKEMVRLQEEEGLADIFITNPGPMTLPRVTGLVDAYLSYPGVYMPSTCFLISTFRDVVSITIGYQDEEGPREVTRKALQHFVGHLTLEEGQVRYQ